MQRVSHLMRAALRSAVAVCAVAVSMTQGFAQQVTHVASAPLADLSPLNIRTVQACTAAIKRLPANAKDVQIVKKILKENLHLRGDRHNFLPHWTADYSDMKIAFDSLTPAQLPALVALLREKKLSSGIKAIGAGTLRIFGAQALPCIRAALEMPGAPVASVLQGVEFSILSESDVQQMENNASQVLQAR